MSQPYFPAQGIALLRELEANNHRDWFHANKGALTESVLEPGQLLLDYLLEALAPVAGTELQGKIFRIQRDVRFSKDKTPYNAHLRLSVWPADMENAAESSSWHFSIEPATVSVGAGVFGFPTVVLDRFRSALLSDTSGFLDCLDGDMRIPEPELARVPKPYPADSQVADHLRRKGMTAWRDEPLESAGAADLPFIKFAEQARRFSSLRKWLDSLYR